MTTPLQQCLDDGLAAHQKGDLDLAKGYYAQALQLDPENSDALHLLGKIALIQEAYLEAIALTERALKQQPQQAIFHLSLGQIYAVLNHHEKAVIYFRKALEYEGSNAEVYLYLAISEQALGAYEQAIEAYQQGLTLAPNLLILYYNLGNVYQEFGCDLEAIESYEQVLLHEPQHTLTRYNLGLIYQNRGELEKACEQYKSVLACDPNFTDARCNLGLLFQSQGLWEEASACYQDCLAHNPDHTEALANYADLLRREHQFSDGLALCQRALAVDPEHANAHYNKAMILLSQERFEEGWIEYEWRWQTDDLKLTRPDLSIPPWAGQPLENETLFVWAEQGIGDEVLFASQFEALAQRTRKARIECDPRLLDLYRRSFPEFDFHPRGESIAGYQFDYQCAIGSLPGLLAWPTQARIPHGAYLKADPEMVQLIRDRYSAYTNKPLVGIAWYSGNKKEGPSRSLDLPAWKPLLTLPAIQCVSVQYNAQYDAIYRFNSEYGTGLVWDPDINPCIDLSAFAAQVAAMDLIISIDNSTVHFAGALGKPVWNLLPYRSDWRWFVEREESLWYESMRLIRQISNEAWEPVIATVYEDLSNYFTKRKD